MAPQAEDAPAPQAEALAPEAPVRIVVLNGGSSAGKSSIARALQDLLPDPWLAFGIDDFVAALPGRLRSPGDGTGIAFGPGGEVVVGDGFRGLEAAWVAGLAATVRAGARIIVDDVFLGGGASQDRLRTAFAGLPVLWAGVWCDAATAAGRERGRPDRVPGMAAGQADLVHRGVIYDVEVDTADTSTDACARAIAARLQRTRQTADRDRPDRAPVRDRSDLDRPDRAPSD
nr:chloramphenicol phosphotransferase [Streptantibioticus silvisoli]